MHLSDPLTLTSQQKKEIQNLSQRQRDYLIQKAKNTKPETPYQLWAYIRAFFKVSLPYKACCPDHQTPFHMVWYLYKNIYPEFAALGSRSSFKTLGLAISETLDLRFGQSSIVHIGAIDKQAQKCYSYVKGFVAKNYGEHLDGEPLAIRTTMKNGNRLEIIPCTMNQVNGPHEDKVRFDEVELANPVAYNDAKGIPVSNYRTGEPPSICYTSTRKFVGGLFGQEIKRLRAQGKPVITFCYKDVSEQCTAERSGTIPVTVWVNRDNFKWSMIREAEEYKSYNVYDGCLKCGLLPTCLGDLKRSHGIIPIADSILRFSTATPDFWIAQGECRKPMRKGLMIYNFDPHLSVEKIDHRIFLDKHGHFDRKRWLFVGGKDFNYSPDATLFAMIDRDTDHVYFFKEFSFHQRTIPDICGEMMQWITQLGYGLPEDIQADKSEPGLISQMRASGFPMTQAVEESDVEGGVDLLNYLCRPMTRPTMVHIDPSLTTFIWEMEEGYKRKLDPKTGEPGEDPDARNNHFVDCARYLLWRWLRKYADPYGEYSGGMRQDTFKDTIGQRGMSLDEIPGKNITSDEMERLSLLMLMNQQKGE